MLKQGISLQEDLIVCDKHTAACYGSGLLPVFATPAMLAWMESVAYKSVEPYLPEGCGTVGAAVKLEHLKASPIGAHLHCVSKLVAVEDRKLTFQIEVYEGEVKVGCAEHIRYVIDNDRFMSKFKK